MKIIIALVALIIGVAAIGANAPNLSAQEPAPLPVNLSLSKAALDSTLTVQDVAGYKITATNSGGIDAEGVDVRDVLPAGYDWFITATAGADCAITDGILVCEDVFLEARHLEEQPNGEIVFVNGVASVTVMAVAHTACTTITNTAVLVWEGVVLSDTELISVACPPTPTPTATSTPTPTSTPTSTPTPVVTSTPACGCSTPTAIATSTRTNVPAPPNTGSGSTQADQLHDDSNAATTLFAMLGLGAVVFAVGGAAIAKRSR